MSRIAVRAGAHVHAVQVIGYVGSTGLSTGPHLHFEVRKNNRPIHPRSFSIASVTQLSGQALRAFKARAASLLAVTPASSSRRGRGDALILPATNRSPANAGVPDRNHHARSRLTRAEARSRGEH